MKRMRHIAWNGLAVVSALLCLAVCVLWALSYWRTLDFTIDDKTGDVGHDYWHFINVACGGGSLLADVRWSKLLITDWEAQERQHGTLGTFEGITTDLQLNGGGGVPYADHSLLGFGYSYTHEENGPDVPYPGPLFGSLGAVRLFFIAAQVPMWFVFLATAILPALRVWSYRRGERSGVCSHCGYDLRATPNRCPECGTVTP